MPVVSGDQLVGFLSLRDLLSADLEEKDAQVQQLNSYIYYAS
jgi:CBS domain-containing protein